MGSCKALIIRMGSRGQDRVRQDAAVDGGIGEHVHCLQERSGRCGHLVGGRQIGPLRGGRRALEHQPGIAELVSYISCTPGLHSLLLKAN